MLDTDAIRLIYASNASRMLAKNHDGNWAKERPIAPTRAICF
jgi:hypothetical protein